jgi:hypothetical protein
MENGPRYDSAAQAASTILNLYWGKDDSKPVLFGKILYTILDAMYEAERGLNERLAPSEN